MHQSSTMDDGCGGIHQHRKRQLDVENLNVPNVSKALTDMQCSYSQIHKEALAVVCTQEALSISLWKALHFGLRSQTLLALFGPSKETPLLAANRLARWTLMLSQYDYSVEFRKTVKMGMRMC